MLQAPRSLEEVPGYEIPYLYFDYLRTGDARPLKGVFYHNAMDVVAMAALLSHTASMLADPFHEGIEHGLDVIAMAKLYEHLGEWETAARLFERGLQMDLGQDYFWEAVRGWPCCRSAAAISSRPSRCGNRPPRTVTSMPTSSWPSSTSTSAGIPARPCSGRAWR